MEETNVSKLSAITERFSQKILRYVKRNRNLVFWHALALALILIGGAIMYFYEQKLNFFGACIVFLGLIILIRTASVLYIRCVVIESEFKAYMDAKKEETKS